MSHLIYVAIVSGCLAKAMSSTPRNAFTGGGCLLAQTAHFQTRATANATS